jgi:ribosomal protein S18 acetylase RimI-like enzyme
VEDIVVRKLKSKDTPSIGKIYQSITQASEMIDIQQVVSELADRKANACFVAEYQGRVVGFIMSYVLSASFGINKSAWIPILGVDPEFMGQGVGKKMAQAVLKFYRKQGIQEIHTSVRWFDSDVLSFFRTLGFNRSEFINLQKRLDE